MAMKTPQEATQKWQQRVSQSGQYYQQGVANPSVDWAGPAEAAAPRRNAGLQAAISDGRIDAGIRRVGTQKWRNNTLQKGVSAWTNNTPQAAPQYLAGMNRVYNSYFPAAQQAVQGMPTTTRQDRINKAQAWLNAVGQAADQYKAQNG